MTKEREGSETVTTLLTGYDFLIRDIVRKSPVLPHDVRIEMVPVGGTEEAERLFAHINAIPSLRYQIDGLQGLEQDGKKTKIKTAHPEEVRVRATVIPDLKSGIVKRNLTLVFDYGVNTEDPYSVRIRIAPPERKIECFTFQPKQMDMLSAAGYSASDTRKHQAGFAELKTLHGIFEQTTRAFRQNGHNQGLKGK